MQTNSRVPRFRTARILGHDENLVTEKLSQKSEGRRISSQVANCATDELNAGALLLVDAVINGACFQFRGFRLQLSNMIGR